MQLEGKGDDGADLRPGDIVWIKGRVTTLAYPEGDVKVRYFARPGYDEFARPRIAAIFLRRSKWNWLRRLFPKPLPRIETSPFDDPVYERKVLDRMKKEGRPL